MAPQQPSSQSGRGRGQDRPIPLRPSTPQNGPSAPLPLQPNRGGMVTRTPPRGSARIRAHRLSPAATSFVPAVPSRLNQSWGVDSNSSDESTSGLSVVTDDSDGFPTVRSRRSKPHNRNQRQLRPSLMVTSPNDASGQLIMPPAPAPAPASIATHPGTAPFNITVPPGYRPEDRGQANLYDRPVESIPSQYPPVNLDPSRQGLFPGAGVPDGQYPPVPEPVTPPNPRPDRTSPPNAPGRTPPNVPPFPLWHHEERVGPQHHYDPPVAPQHHYDPPVAPYTSWMYAAVPNPSANPQSPSAPYMPGFAAGRGQNTVPVIRGGPGQSNSNQARGRDPREPPVDPSLKQ